MKVAVDLGPRLGDGEMASRRVATPDSVAVFWRRYATRSSLGHGSVDWKSTATIGHRYAVSQPTSAYGHAAPGA